MIPKKASREHHGWPAIVCEQMITSLYLSQFYDGKVLMWHRKMTKGCEQNTSSQVVFILLAEHVALPANGTDVVWMIGVRLYLLPQTAHGGVDPARFVLVS